MSGLTWHSVLAPAVDALAPCSLPSAHPVLTSPGLNWPCTVAFAPSLGSFPLSGREAGEAEERHLLIGVGMRDPTRLTSDMLRLDELLWPQGDKEPPHLHLFIRVGAFMELILKGMPRLLKARAVQRLELDLVPWGLRSMSTTPGRTLSMIGSVGFGIFQKMTGSKQGHMRFVNKTGAQQLVECEGGLLPTKLVAWRRPDIHVDDLRVNWVPHNAWETCCFVPWYRGRGTKHFWDVCCSPKASAVELEACQSKVPHPRNLRSCCGPRNPLAALARYKTAMRSFRNSSLRSEVRNVSRSVEALYDRCGATLTAPPFRGVVFHPRLRDEDDGSRFLHSVSALSIALPDVELFVWLRNRLWMAGAAASWLRWPIFVLGNAFGYSTFVLAKLFPGASIDVLDAEVDEGVSTLGSPLTRHIAHQEKFDVKLYAGFAPEAVPQAARASNYGLVFLDGKHTVQQLLLDFEAILPFLAESAVVVCHDIAHHGMSDAVAKILQADIGKGFSYKIYPSVNFVNELGTGYFYRGFREDVFLHA